MSGVPREAKALGDGFYEHNHELHVDLDEYILAAGGNPNNEHDRAMAEAAIRKIAGEQHGIHIEERYK